MPGTTLDKVKWTKGDAADKGMLEELAGEADGVVHSIGLLLDSESGLGEFLRSHYHR